MNKEQWNKKLNTPNYVYGTEPILFLKENIQRLRKGKALDVAMGEGRNAVFLASHEFQVSGFDTSQAAVEKALKLAQSTGVQLETKATDLDFYLFGIMKWDTIILSYFKPVPRYFFEIKRSLVQGGTLLLENYTTDLFHVEKEPEVDPEDCFKPNEVLKHVEGLRVLFYQETSINNKPIVQCLAKKPYEKDAVKYGFATVDEKKEPSHSAQTKRAEDLFKKK